MDESLVGKTRIDRGKGKVNRLINKKTSTLKMVLPSLIQMQMRIILN
jgi:hypothetical protein